MYKKLFALVMILGLVACASVPQQQPVELPADYFKQSPGRIGVVMSVPAPDTAFPGAGCLLCYATASAMNSSLTTAVKAWPVEDVQALKNEMVTLLRARGVQAIALEQPLMLNTLPDRQAELGFARKSFATLAKSASVDRLLVINVQALGAWRNYASYIPTGAPQAVFKGEAYLVDAGTDRLEWFDKFDLALAAEGEWDEAPKFPGLSNAYFQVLERGKDQIKKSFQ